jgi:hypothetical protein
MLYEFLENGVLPRSIACFFKVEEDRYNGMSTLKRFEYFFIQVYQVIYCGAVFHEATLLWGDDIVFGE